jgi:hypothetical protein
MYGGGLVGYGCVGQLSSPSIDRPLSICASAQRNAWLATHSSNPLGPPSRIVNAHVTSRNDTTTFAPRCTAPTPIGPDGGVRSP